MSLLDELRQPVLCYVTDRRSLPAATDSPAPARAALCSGGFTPPPGAVHLDALLRQIERAVSAGVDWIQIREKDLSGRELAALVRSALDLARHSRSRVFVNDRMDIALAAGARGVHLGENGLPVQEARRLRSEFFARHNLENDFLIGRSCHSLESALAAARDGADYLYFGPVFPTPSKIAYGPPQGLESLAEVCRAAVPVPVLAIGGITPANAPDCLRAGASGIAAIRLFQDSPNLPSVVAALRAFPPAP